ELNAARAHAGRRAPLRADIEARLQIGIAVLDPVQLVALERTLHAGIVDVALPVLGHAVELDAAGQAQRPALVEAQRVRELRGRTGIAAAELHDAAARGRCRLRGEWR